MKKAMKILFLIVMAFVAPTATSLAWDPLGHMIVCEIALQSLTPESRKSVDDLMASFNQENSLDHSFVTAGTWMDDIRRVNKSYNTWHYITLPENEQGEPFPPPNQENVLSGMLRCLGILNGSEKDPAISPGQALVMLTHLVADAHQPLHATSRNDDRGGNRVIVSNLVDPELEIFNSRPNLHWFWDIAYRQRFSDSGTIIADYAAPRTLPTNPLPGHWKAVPIAQDRAAQLLEAYPKPPSLAEPADWIRESHDLGWNFAYAELPGGPDANPVSLPKEYVDKARQISERRLVEAGFRLGAILNQALSDP